MKIRILYKTIAAFCFCTILGSCMDEYLDINDDPNNPLEASLPLLMTSSQADIAGALGNSIGGLSAIPQAYTQQMFQRGITEQDYALTGSDFEVITPWNILYTRGLMDIEQILEQGREQEAWSYVGVAQILKAYTFSLMVDVWGNVPYAGALEGPENLSPAYQSGETVYPELLALLDSGMMNLERESIIVMGSDDVFYDGDLSLWRKFAKTVKLKMYNQIRLVEDVSAEVTALLEEGDLISDQGEDFEFPYSTSVSPENRNPAYVQEYEPGAAQFYINPFFYETLAGLNTFSHRGYGVEIGMADPRIPYYFYDQLSAGEPAENPCAYCETDVNGNLIIPQLEGTGFLSIYMFSFNIDPNEGFSQSVSQTVAGLYPVGGRYDEGEGVPVNFNGEGDVPQRLLTYFARKYIEAELYLTGVVSGDAEATLREAIQASFDKVNQVASNASHKSVPAIPQEEIDLYIEAVMADYAAADTEGKLEHIITQKWIASYGFAIDAYTDYRRTGYPVLHDGNEDNLATTSRTRGYPYSFPWVTANLEINASAPDQKQIATPEARVFWDPN